MNTVIPPKLEANDTIALISTARKTDHANIAYATKLIQKWGYRILEGKNLYKEDHQFAGTDAERLQDLNDAIRNPDVKAILLARGGYGTARIVDGVDLKALHNQPKWIIGYSDITVLHNHIYKHIGMASLHATMPLNFQDNTPQALHSLQDGLKGISHETEIMHHRLNVAGEATGELIGGNLSVICSMMGSSTQMDTKGCILFIEDVDEYLYHMDRMMVCLKRAGMLSAISGMVVGSLTNMRDNQIPFGMNADEIIANNVAEYGYPVCFNYPSGHISDNRAWIHGKKVRLTVKHGQPSLLIHN